MKVESMPVSHFNVLISVAQLLKEPAGSSRKYDIRGIVGEQARSSIQGEVTLVRTGQGILVRGELDVKVRLVCSRCLDVFPDSISLRVEEEFLPTTHVFDGLPLALSEERPSSTIDSNHMLDLGEVIRQYTLLNLPMKPLCRPDCTGIKEMD